MPSTGKARGPIRFGVFEADLMSHTLRKRGVRMPLQELPFRMLAMLLARPGEVVTREELKQELWSEEDFGEFDLGLNTAVKKLRQALDDSANTPRFIETIPKVGYRFLVPVAASPGHELSSADSADSTVQTVNPVESLSPVFVPVRRSIQRALQGLAAVLGIALVGTVAVLFTQAPPETPEQPVRRFSFSQEGLSSASISPDGRYVAFAAGTIPESSLWLRAIGTETPREIPGTEGARERLGWSPDSQSIVFATTTEIKRLNIDGGDPVTLGDLPGTGPGGVLGSSWSPDGDRIVFGSRGRLHEIPARGGEPQVLVDNDLGTVQQPHFLPANSGPESLAYQTNAPYTAYGAQIWVLNLETGERSEVGPGSAPVYSRDGYLLHGSGEETEDRLFALPFSLESLEPTGDAFPIAEESQFASVARDGTLVFLDGNTAALQETLVWRNRAGELLETIGQPQQGMSRPALSPDGRRIAIGFNESGNSDIWIHDLIRSTKTRLTFDEGTEYDPIWLPSGGEIAYTQLGTGWSLMRKSADGTGEAVVLVETDLYAYAEDWSTDGRYLAYSLGTSEARTDIRYVELQSDGETSEPVTFLGTPNSESVPRFSPDGRFVAYRSSESGRNEVYVRPFPEGTAGKWLVSANGGSQQRWRGDGKELYYVEDSTMMAVSVSTEPTFTLGQPQPLFESADLIGRGDGRTMYDVAVDGERFVTVSPVEVPDEEAAPPSVRVVQNWYEEFRDREE